MQVDSKRTKRAKARTLARKECRRLKRERACDGIPCVEGCPMVACRG